MSEPTLIPILCTIAELDDVFRQNIVYLPVSEDLALFLAHVAITPGNSLSWDYLPNNSELAGNTSVPQLFAVAFKNYAPGLEIESAVKFDRTFYLVKHKLRFGSSAVGLPTFYDDIRKYTGVDEFFVAIVNPSQLVFTDFNNKEVSEQLQQIALNSKYNDAVKLTPSCYKLTADGLKCIAKRPPQVEAMDVDDS